MVITIVFSCQQPSSLRVRLKKEHFNNFSFYFTKQWSISMKHSYSGKAQVNFLPGIYMSFVGYSNLESAVQGQQKRLFSCKSLMSRTLLFSCVKLDLQLKEAYPD